MGGLYNVVFGYNPYSRAILTLLHLRPEDFGRFRDAWIANGEIIVYTRCGGGNREDYPQVFAQMKEHPDFLRDKDDTFDTTYCTFYFKIPQDAAENEQVVQILKSMDIGAWNPDARWRDAIDRMKAGNLNEREQKLMEQFGEKLKSVEGGGKVRSFTIGPEGDVEEKK